MKVLAIILNYKTYELTLDLIQQLQGIHYTDLDILVVDNCSPNESAEILEEKKSELGYELIANDKNAGYAAGNNVGIRYAIEHGYEYSWILNNDLRIVDEDILNKLMDSMNEHKDVACVGPQSIDIDGFVTAPYCEQPTVWNMTFGIGMTRKERAKYKEISRKVYRVFGCCMLLKNEAMQLIDCMDESTFLYCEEEILAERLKAIDKTCYYCADAKIVHLESMTVKKEQGNRSIKRIKTVLNSMDIYLKNYLKLGWFKRNFCKLTRATIMFLRG